MQHLQEVPQVEVACSEHPQLDNQILLVVGYQVLSVAPVVAVVVLSVSAQHLQEVPQGDLAFLVLHRHPQLALSEVVHKEVSFPSQIPIVRQEGPPLEVLSAVHSQSMQHLQEVPQVRQSQQIQ
jgi:hypothetical protein